MLNRLKEIDITGVGPFLFGQEEDREGMTGVTAIIAKDGAICGVDVRGGSPGTRDISALDPKCNRKEVHAVMLAGGSTFGLDAAGGLMELLEEKEIGRSVGITVIPNVAAAIIFDLRMGNMNARPDKAMGRRAGENAFRGMPFLQGNYGGGTGAGIGGFRGPKYAMKGGVGAAAFQYGDLKAGAVFVVNCVGDIVEDGEIIAGARQDDGLTFACVEDLMLASYTDQKDYFSGQNTVIGCVFTNAILDKAKATKLAAIAQNGVARTIYPANTNYDGDTIFSLCSCEVEATLDAVGIMASHAAQCAIINAVKHAESIGTVMSYKERIKRLKTG